MALTAQPTGPSGWTGWPQQHNGREYGMMDPGMMPYEPRHVAPSPLPRSPLSPSYYSNQTFSAAPMTTMAAPHYQHPPLTYSGYAPFTPSPTPQSPYEERTQLPVHPADIEPVRPFHAIRDCNTPVMGTRCPSEGRSVQTSPAPSVASASRRGSKVITSNIPINEESKIDFNTGVDILMKAIQSTSESDVVVKTVESENHSVPDYEIKAEQKSDDEAESPSFRLKAQHRKRYVCDIPGCDKTFPQKTHLETHRRSHTGEKPYVCRIPGCGKRFSQHGNMTTHERRHTGERPFHCTLCGKRFVQRGGLVAHMKTHSREKSKDFVCKLDNCGKTFTERGNLKGHLNKFHLDTLLALSKKFSTITDHSTIPKAERELWQYFSEVFKNSNKGIKGRGKHRKVGCITQASPLPFSEYHCLPQLHTPHSMHTPLPYHGLSHPAAYSMSRPPMMVDMARETHHHGYPMFDADVASVTSSASASSVGAPMYDEDHGRELAFGDRMY